MIVPEIEAIVPAFNAARDLRACLTGLMTAGFAPSEITVVDDGSQDTTVEIAKNEDVTVLPMPRRSGAAAARDFGVRHTTAPIILFVDSDVVVAENTRAQTLAAFRDSGTAAVFGAYDTAPASPGLVAQYRNLLHRYVHLTGPDAPQTFWTGLGAVRRTAYLQIGGFDSSQRMMEDIEFGLRLTEAGLRIIRDPDLNGQHRKHWSLVGMARMDLFDRAIPWTQLMKRHGLSRELNLSRRHRLSAVMALLVFCSLLILPFHPAAWIMTLVALFGFGTCNFGFLKSLVEIKGWPFAIAAIGPHLVHTWCAITGFAWVSLVQGKPSPAKTSSNG